MVFKDLIKIGIGLAGKYAMHAAKASPYILAAGIAGKVALSSANKHAGLIGQKMNELGNKYFSDKTRERLSNVANKVIDYMPDGKIEDTLTKINDAAQTNSNPISTIERPKRKTS